MKRRHANAMRPCAWHQDHVVRPSERHRNRPVLSENCEGRAHRSTLRADIDYGTLLKLATTYGVIGAAVWVCLGDSAGARFASRRNSTPIEERRPRLHAVMAQVATVLVQAVHLGRPVG